MPETIKVKRPGLAHGKKREIPFDSWLAAQKRKELTYQKEIERKDEVGWTVTDFIEESRHRGIKLNLWTVIKWKYGTQPRDVRYELEKIFPGIKF